MLLEKYDAQYEESVFPELFNTHISSFLFIDDSEIFSFSKNGLHEKLEKYCRKWDLNLNLKKTKIIKLNKQGNTIKSLNFIIGEKKFKLLANMPT